jgi:N-acetyl-anhydromuramyl-L-alanine amidase AmpD
MSWYPELPHDQAGGHGGARAQTQMVVIHCTDNTASAEAEAHYAEHRADGISAHFYGDDDSIVQALDTAVVAYGCFATGNARSVQFELTGLSNQVSDAAMRQAAKTVRRACVEFGIPVRHVGPDELRAGQKGICGHGDVTRAWGEGDHTDPGDSFPWATFIGYVQNGDEMTTDWAAVTAIQIGSTDLGYQDLTAPAWARGYGTYNLRDIEARTKDRIDKAVLAIKASQQAPAPPTDAQMEALAQRVAAIIGGSIAAQVGDLIAARMKE